MNVWLSPFVMLLVENLGVIAKWLVSLFLPSKVKGENHQCFYDEIAALISFLLHLELVPPQCWGLASSIRWLVQTPAIVQRKRGLVSFYVRLLENFKGHYKFKVKLCLI